MAKEKIDHRDVLPDENSQEPAAPGELRKNVRRLLGAGPLGPWAVVRERILALPQALDGLNIQRVEDFLTERGCSHTPYVVIDVNDRSRVSDFFSSFKLDSLAAQNADTQTMGFFSANLQCVIIYRDRSLERQNDTMSTERLIAHELAHSSGAAGIILDESGGVIRHGYVEHDRGAFLDEGYANLMEQGYVARYRSMASTAKVAATVGMDAEEFDTTLIEREGGMTGKEYLLGAAWQLDAEGNASRNVTAVAGSTMAILYNKYPELESLLLRARSDVRALRDLKRWFDQFGPDTYTRVRDAQYTEEDFVKVQQMLFERAL